MLFVSKSISIPERELRVQFFRGASGPGGQNVNKVATAAELRFDAAGSPSLSPAVRARLLHLAGRRATADGVIVLTSGRFRTQEANRRDVQERLLQLIRRAAVRPKRRVPTAPTRAARERRLEQKRRRGSRKRLRDPVRPDG